MFKNCSLTVRFISEHSDIYFQDILEFADSEGYDVPLGKVGRLYEWVESEDLNYGMDDIGMVLEKQEAVKNPQEAYQSVKIFAALPEDGRFVPLDTTIGREISPFDGL